MTDSSNRVSIKSWLMPYIEQVGKQLGTDDVSEIVNQIILDHKLHTAIPQQQLPLAACSVRLQKLIAASFEDLEKQLAKPPMTRMLLNSPSTRPDKSSTQP